MKEQTIAKFKYNKDTYKMLEITTIAGGYDEVARTCYDTYHYIILKNRRRITQSKWKETAQKKFANIITSILLQTDIPF